MQVEKEPGTANTSVHAQAVQSSGTIVGDIYVGHVRLASRGGRTRDNTHPFRRDFRGRPVIFAHNGTLRCLPEPATYGPVGETDSELAMCLFLAWMEAEDVSFTDFARVEDWLRELNEHGSMNLLFSDGVRLFAYRDQDGYNGLCLTRRQAPFPTVTLEDEDWFVDLGEEKGPSERGFVIASRPLTDESWTDLWPGSLLVACGGMAVYGGLT